METVLMYLLKMLICSAILYSYYRVALYNERFHQWNRFYLLLSMILSVVVPFISIPVIVKPEDINLAAFVTALPWNANAHTGQNEEITGQRFILTVAAVVSAVLLVKFLYGILKIFKAYQSNPVSRLQNNIQLIITDLTHAPFSFFNWLFWRGDIDPGSENGRRMLNHELAHIHEHHSIDKTFTSILLCFFWMNPFLWLIQKELGMIHEFLADRKAIKSQDGAAFAEMILQAFPLKKSLHNTLINPFYSSQIKRRLLMITTSKSPKYTYLRRVSGLAIMICCAGVLALSIQNTNAQQPAKKKAEGSQQSNPSDTAEKKTKVSIQSKDGQVPLYIIDGKEIEQAKAKDINPQNIKSIDVLKGQSALEKYGDKGKNGVILITMKTNGEKMTPREEIFINHPDSTVKLIYVDGKLITEEELKKMDPKDIESMSVFKGDDAIKKYGEKGKNGVIEIALKKPKT